MAYQTLTLQMLISAPSDIPFSDLEAIKKTVSQWNLNYGRTFGLTVLPVSWTEHAVTAFGDRPQAMLNDQIVNDADFAIALFCDRLGTPTGTSASGTDEEIRVLVSEGKTVGVLVNTTPRPPLDSQDLAERQRLTDYLSDLKESALVFSYADEAQLISHLNNFLSRATGRFQQAIGVAKEEAEVGADPNEGVWPSAEVNERVETDSKGRIKTRRHWALVLRNTSRGPAENVDFTFTDVPDGRYFGVVRGDGPLGTIPPGGEARFSLLLAAGSPTAVTCLVTWTDSHGVSRETQATVRT